MWLNFITLTDRVFFLFFFETLSIGKNLKHKRITNRFFFGSYSCISRCCCYQWSVWWGHQTFWGAICHTPRRKIQKQNMPTTNDTTGLGMNLPFCWQGFTLNISLFLGGEVKGWWWFDDLIPPNEYGDIHHFIAKPWSIEGTFEWTFGCFKKGLEESTIVKRPTLHLGKIRGITTPT